MPQPYRSQVLDHLGLVAGMFDELGIGAVIDQATRQNPETRMVTVGNAVKAMILNGLGLVNQQLYLVPLFFSTNRRTGSSPRPQPSHARLDCGAPGGDPAADATTQWQYQRRE